MQGLAVTVAPAEAASIFTCRESLQLAAAADSDHGAIARSTKPNIHKIGTRTRTVAFTRTEPRRSTISPLFAAFLKTRASGMLGSTVRLSQTPRERGLLLAQS